MYINDASRGYSPDFVKKHSVSVGDFCIYKETKDSVAFMILGKLRNVRFESIPCDAYSFEVKLYFENETSVKNEIITIMGDCNYWFDTKKLGDVNRYRSIGVFKPSSIASLSGSTNSFEVGSITLRNVINMKSFNIRNEIDNTCLKARAYCTDPIDPPTVCPNQISGSTSDGYHTFDELYDHRAKLFSVIVSDHRDQCWKAKHHYDGSMYDGMFIVGIDTPTGQATYHYNIDPYWDMFYCVELDRAPEWDGHTPDQAIARIASLAKPGNALPLHFHF